MSEEKKYYIHDYESGTPIEVSKEQWERYHSAMKRAFELARPKLNYNGPGRITIFGTSGDFNYSGANDVLFEPPSGYDYKSVIEEFKKNDIKIIKPYFMSNRPAEFNFEMPKEYPALNWKEFLNGDIIATEEDIAKLGLSLDMEDITKYII